MRYKASLYLLLLILILLPFIILSFYNHPCMDDFVVAKMIQEKGFFETQKLMYNHWGGRYFSDILRSFNPFASVGYRVYKLNAIVFLLLLLITTYWLTGKLFKNISITGKLG